MNTKVHVVLLFVVIALVGIVPAEANWFTGTPERIVGIKEGTVDVSLQPYTDISLGQRAVLWDNGNTTGNRIVAAIRGQAGPIVVGYLNFTPGSGEGNGLDLWVDSDPNYFQQITPPNSSVSQEEWMQAVLREPSKWSRIKRDWGWNEFPPFVSCSWNHGRPGGPFQFAFNVANLAEGIHFVYARVKTRDGANRPTPPEAVFKLYVVKQGSPEANAMLNGTPFGTTDACGAGAPPPTTQGSTSGAQYALLDDAKELPLDEQAQNTLRALADELGYTGPLGRRAQFRLKPNARTTDASAVVFFVRNGQLAGQGETLSARSNNGWAKSFNLPAEGYAYFRHIPMAADVLQFACPGFALETGNTDDPSAAFWLPVGR